MDCGTVEEFVDPEIETRQNAIAKRMGYLIEEHSLVLYGRCQRPDCPARKAGRVKRVI
jgi:Fur family ferric uptake transcriptional regulator